MYSSCSGSLSFSSPELELCDREEVIKDGSEMPCFNKSTYMIQVQHDQSFSVFNISIVFTA